MDMENILKDTLVFNYFIGQTNEGQLTWKNHLKTLYDGLVAQERKHKLYRQKDALNNLYINELDSEQIWQQIELINRSCIETTSRVTDYEISNLTSQVSFLELLGNDDTSLGILGNCKSDKPVEKLDGDASYNNLDKSYDEGLGSGEDEENDSEIPSDLEEHSDSDLEEHSDSDYDNIPIISENEDNDEEEVEDEDIAELEDNDIPSGFSDSDSENDDKFGDLALEGVEDDDDESESENEEDLNIISKEKTNTAAIEPPTFNKTSVDSQFLLLRESEWIADNDIIGENCSENFDDINFMSDLEDSGDDTVMYKDFFGDPKKQQPILSRKLKSCGDQSNETEGKHIDEHIPKEEDMQEEDAPAPLLGGTKKQVKSAYEKLLEKDTKGFEVLEENNVADKEWVMKGEIQSADRPENSVLEQDLDYTVSASQRPTTTEETTEQLEKFILGVIRSGAFDDVERKVKPISDPNEYKKKLLLDQGKSQKSLADIYEEEYLKQRDANKRDENEEELEEHKEIRTKMNNLFSMLDALANYHYTPRQKSSELKIVSNLPALTMEEATPTYVNDGTLLAPQEIVSSTRGDLQGNTEKSTTDKKRERRKKKSFQKKKSLTEDLKMKKKLQSMSKDGKKLDVSTSAKVVEKAIKKGQIKLMEKSNNKVARSFKDVNNSNKRKTEGSVNSKSKKSKSNIESSTKLLL